MIINNLTYFYTHRLPIALAAVEAGYDVHIGTYFEVGSELKYSDTITYHAINFCKNSVNPFKSVVTMYQLAKLYRRIRPSIVHHVAMKPILYGTIVARFMRRIRCVNAISGLGYLFLHDTIKVKLLRQVLLFGFRFGFSTRRCSFIFQNEDDKLSFIKKRLIKKYNDTAIIRGCGVDLTSYHYAIPKNKRVIIVLPARLLWDKGVGEFVSAARILKEKTTARFVLVGKLDFMNPACIEQSDIDKWVGEGVIEHWGWQGDMRHVFAMSDIVCLPSYREGMPKALLEAAASGCAIVTTDTTGCRDVIEDGESGYLVPVKDFCKLSERLQELIESQKLRIHFSKNARKRAEDVFSLERITTQHNSVYEKML